MIEAIACAVVTNRRLWCHVEGQWVNFDYDTITGYALHGQAVTLSFIQAEIHGARLQVYLVSDDMDLAPWYTHDTVAKDLSRHGPC